MTGGIFLERNGKVLNASEEEATAIMFALADKKVKETGRVFERKGQEIGHVYWLGKGTLHSQCFVNFDSTIAAFNHSVEKP